MNKKEFFVKLHQELENRYKLPVCDIETIRSKSFTKESFILFLQTKIDNITKLVEQLNKTLEKRKNFRLDNPSYIESNNKKIQGLEIHIKQALDSITKKQITIEIAKSLTEIAWKDITQKTEFDKHTEVVNQK